MFSRLERLLMAAYRKQRFNELQISIWLFFTRIYRSSRRHYHQLVRSSRPSQEVSSLNSEEQHWQWPGFPRLPSFFWHYERLTTSYMAYTFVRNVFLVDGRLESLVELERPSHCYLIGHFHSHTRISRNAATVLVSFHLAWRLYQTFFKRPFFLSMFYFLLISDDDLRRFKYRLALEGTRAPRKQNQQMDTISKDDGHLFDLTEGDVAIYKFFRRVLCYKIGERHSVRYRIRSNRTPEARQVLQRRIAQCTIYVGCVLSLIGVLVFTFITFSELDDRSYLVRYPKCDAELEARNERHELPYWSYSMRNHQLLTHMADFLESFIIWFDSGMAVFWIWTEVYFLNYDAQLHWTQLACTIRHVERCERLGHLYARAKTLRVKDRDKVSKRAGMITRSDSVQRQPEFQDAIQDLQAQVHDFFKHISEIDRFISDIITSSILVWLVGCTGLGLWALSMHAENSDNDRASLPLIIFMIGVYFLIVTVVTSFMLELHRDCLRSYTTLCSLIAHAHVKHKKNLARLLEFYTVKKRSAYTLFHQYPYTKTTYLSTFGWTVSCFFIFNNLMKRDKPH